MLLDDEAVAFGTSTTGGAAQSSVSSTEPHETQTR